MSTQVQAPARSSFPVVLAIIVLFVLFWFLTSKIYVNAPVPVAPVVPDARPTLAEHRGKANAALEGFKVTDAANGKVRLPIERAKELVLKENAK